jgi:uncharacterized protein
MVMNDREIAEYLLAHPEFFDRQAELLADIRLKSPYDNYDRVVSLQTRQLDMLREKYQQLERQQALLLHCGHQNDEMARTLDLLLVQLLAENDPCHLPDRIIHGLREFFDLPHAALRLWAEAHVDTLSAFTRPVSKEICLFANRLSSPYCGQNTGVSVDLVEWLQADHAESTTPQGAPVSIACMALRAPYHEKADAFGLLVIGSPDPNRFHDQMANDFLLRIGKLASAALSRLLK